MKNNTRLLWNRLNSFDKRSSLVNIDAINNAWTGDSEFNHNTVLGSDKSNRKYVNGVPRAGNYYSKGHDESYYSVLNKIDNFNRPFEQAIPDEVILDNRNQYIDMLA